MSILLLSESQLNALLAHLDLADEHCEENGLEATEQELEPLQTARVILERALHHRQSPPLGVGW